jgi:hypothetical protein
MKRIHISSLIVIGAVTTFLSSRAPAAQPSDVAPSAVAPQADRPQSKPSAPSKDFACGTKENPCPMQKWMKANMAPAAANGDAAALKTALTYVAGHAPPGFDKWTAIATEGATAAGKGDVDGAKKGCKTCHDLYKAKYKEEMRDRAF